MFLRHSLASCTFQPQGLPISAENADFNIKIWLLASKKTQKNELWPPDTLSFCSLPMHRYPFQLTLKARGFQSICKRKNMQGTRPYILFKIKSMNLIQNTRPSFASEVYTGQLFPLSLGVSRLSLQPPTSKNHRRHSKPIKLNFSKKTRFAFFTARHEISNIPGNSTDDLATILQNILTSYLDSVT